MDSHWLHIVVDSRYSDCVKFTLEEKNKKYLKCHHQDSKKHDHYLFESHGKSADTCRAGFTVQLKRNTTRWNLPTPKMGKNRDVHITIYTKTVEEWLRYVKHENSAELSGNMSEEHREFFDNVTVKEAVEAKTKQVDEVREFTYQKEMERRKFFYHQIMDFVKKYKMTTPDITDYHLSEEDHLTYISIPGKEYYLQDCVKRVRQFRYRFEQQCRDPATKFKWWHVALINLMRSAFDTKELNFIRSENIDYCVAGAKLIQHIFENSRVDPQDFNNGIEQVLECQSNKVNSIFIYGQPDSGKTTISKILCSGFLRCMLGQIGNASQFIFQELPGKSLMQIEEATFNPQNVEDFKNVTGGATDFEVNVKNNPHAKINHRTPVITTGNVLPWETWCSGEAEAFRKRGHIYHFRRCMTKGFITELCDKYEHVQKSRGELYVSLVHYLIYMASVAEEISIEDIAPQIIKGFSNLAYHPSIDTEDDLWSNTTFEDLIRCLSDDIKEAPEEEDNTEEHQPPQKKVCHGRARSPSPEPSP